MRCTVARINGHKSFRLSVDEFDVTCAVIVDFPYHFYCVR